MPGTADLRVHQPFDQPKIHINVDRTKAVESGFTQLDVANSALISLSGSSQTTPEFWLDPRNGVSYAITTQTPQFAIASLSDLRNIPIKSTSGSSGTGSAARPEILESVERPAWMRKLEDLSSNDGPGATTVPGLRGR